MSDLFHCGLLSARIERLGDRVVVHAPLYFEGEVVRAEGLWVYGADTTNDDAICDSYADAFNEWARRAEELRAERELLQPRPRYSLAGGIHQSCRDLWGLWGR
jgi:hypothetical protein